MTKVKICGIRNEEDALYCVRAGADAIGLVFADSPRKIDMDTARRISVSLPPFINRIGVFVDAEKDLVERVALYCCLTSLQFHGSESAEYCRSFALPVLKAVRVRGAADLDGLDSFPASAFVLDTYHPKLTGGTGLTFDWTLAQRLLPRPVVLAGGLHAGNVADAVRTVRPYAVDVSGGVETDGRKDREKIKAFIEAVRGYA